MRRADVEPPQSRGGPVRGGRRRSIPGWQMTGSTASACATGAAGKGEGSRKERWETGERAADGGRADPAGRRQPTMTAPATTVVQSPCLSPTAVWVTAWVRTILFDRR